jgi:hypothetical protein
MTDPTTDKPAEAVRLIWENAEEASSAADGASAGQAPPDRGEPPGRTERPRPDRGLPEGCPVTPLGLQGDLYYYLDALDQLRELKAKDHSRLNLVSLFGDDEGALYKLWPRVTKDGAVIGWNPGKLAEELMAACARRGVWDVWGRLRGPGAWLADDGRLVLHCGDGLAISAPPAEPGTESTAEIKALRPAYHRPGPQERYVYPTAPAQPRPAEAPQTGQPEGPATALLELLSTWRWARGETDAFLMLGWICCAIVGGALRWRPAVWITGDKHTGKSTLHELLRLVMGDAIVSVSDATPAGIWQKLRHASLPVAIDEIEAEADNRRANQVVALARQASSGGLVLRGGADHQGAEFVARSCFLLSSILMPPLLSQDRSRLAILELGRLEAAVPPALEAAPLGLLGQGLRRRLFDQWPRFKATLEAYRAALTGPGGHTGRGADQFGTLLAVADLALYDWPPEGDTLAGWAEKLKAAGLAEVSDDLADHERCLEQLRGSIVDVFKGGRKQVLGAIVAEAAGRRGQDGTLPDVTEATATLALFGLKVELQAERQFLAVANKHRGLDQVFRDTHWAGRSGTSGGWVQALRRVPGMVRPKSALRFGAIRARCILVPLDAALGEEEEE